ncbi:MAG: tRNA (adenosine(37)-N6)-dimethylallyltransferase MiaA [Oligosphaeraceae bacterium]|nr:tRNA (adenosine(37)-N6)-dimethylallyltransferase MiaA [Oligosphaeraceae bacterium]
MAIDRTPCLIVTGPTATGKTRLAVALARKYRGEIVSADSRQVYRGLDIGTGKDLQEYGSGDQRVPAHLLDVVNPGEEFHLFRFVQLAREAIEDISSRDRLPVIVGGSPLYLQALLDGYALEGAGPDPAWRQELEELSDAQLLEMLRQQAAPELLARTDLTQRRRVIRALEIARSGGGNFPREGLHNTLILAPKYPRAVCHQRIELRLDQRLAQGLPEEVERLHQQGLSWEKMDWLGLEYRCLAQYFQGQLSWPEMRQTLLARIRQFCKRQDIWFRKMEREGKQIHWLPEGDFALACRLTEEWLSGQSGFCTR